MTEKSPGPHAGGRPTKYDPQYCEAVIAALSDGASLTSFAAEIGVARSTINKWVEDYPEFSEACARAKTKAGAWWEKLARRLAATGEGNAQMVMLGVKNMAREDWVEPTAKIDHTSSDGSMTPKTIVTGMTAQEAAAAYASTLNSDKK